MYVYAGATIIQEGHIALWNLATFSEQRRISDLHYDTVNDIAFTPDGCRFITSCIDCTIKVSVIIPIFYELRSMFRMICDVGITSLFNLKKKKRNKRKKWKNHGTFEVCLFPIKKS